jgi:hypothetical protein
MPSPYAVHVVDDEITLHRPCFGADDPLLLYALRSNHENGRAGAEVNALLATSVSMFERVETVTRLARRRPERVGSHIMTVILLPEFGFYRAETGAPGHHSIWGSPHRLLECITAVRPLR